MTSLRDHFLLAMPQLKDPYFGDSLVYLCQQNQQGSMGLIVNKPMELNVGELLEQINLPGENCDAATQAVYCGGPLNAERGFVLHTGPACWKGSLPVSDAVTLTTSVDILEALACNQGPDEFLITLGCASWEAGQLEDELKENTWLTCAAWEQPLFKIPAEERLDVAAARLGVELGLISRQVGHA